MTFSEYYRRANPHLLALLPKRARRILEIGCGAGALGTAFKREINPECHYTGVELVADAAEEASTMLDRVVRADTETLTNDKLEIEDGSLDSLVYGDVLEHLVDPTAELLRRAPLLAERGIVLACIPNIGHWSVITRLLMGEFPYEDSGILDRTHLRFFTRASIRTLFEEAGYAVTKIQGIPKESPPFSDKFFETLEPAIAVLGLDPDTFRNSAINLQYVVKARPRKKV